LISDPDLRVAAGFHDIACGIDGVEKRLFSVEIDALDRRPEGDDPPRFTTSEDFEPYWDHWLNSRAERWGDRSSAEAPAGVNASLSPQAHSRYNGETTSNGAGRGEWGVEGK
jgi:hypothetical protein